MSIHWTRSRSTEKEWLVMTTPTMDSTIKQFNLSHYFLQLQNEWDVRNALKKVLLFCKYCVKQNNPRVVLIRISLFFLKQTCVLHAVAKWYHLHFCQTFLWNSNLCLNKKYPKITYSVACAWDFSNYQCTISTLPCSQVIFWTLLSPTINVQLAYKFSW